MSLPTQFSGAGAPAVGVYEGALYQREDAGQGNVYVVHNGVWVRLLTTVDSIAVTLAGDTTGPTGSNINVGLTGVAGTTAMHMANLTWDAAVASPKLGQALATSGGGQGMTVAAQDGAHSGVTVGGTLFLSSGAGFGAGSAGQVAIQWAGASIASFNPTLAGPGVAVGGLFLDAPNVVFGASQAAANILQQDATSGAGHVLSISAQKGFAGSNGGSLFLSSGDGVQAGQVVVRWGASTVANFDPTTNGLLLSRPNLLFDAGQAAPTFGQQGTAVAGSGQNLIIKAQGGQTSGNTSGGAVIVQSGPKFGSGNDGAIIFQWGSFGAVGAFDPGISQGLALFKPNIIFASTVTAPMISQAPSSAGGQSLTIQAQDALQSGNTVGGNVFLTAGRGHGTGVAGAVILSYGPFGSSPSVIFGTDSAATPTVSSMIFGSIGAAQITQALTGGIPGTMLIKAQSSSGAFQGGGLDLRTGSGGSGASGLMRFLFGNDSIPTFGIDPGGAWDIFTGSPTGGTPTVAGQLQHNNEVHIFWDELITTPAPDTAGVNAFMGIHCTVELPGGGQLDGFVPIYAYVP